MPTLPPISPELFKAYQEEISKTSSESTLKRKQISLNRFFDWAEKNGKLDKNPIEKTQPDISGTHIIKRKGKVGARTWTFAGVTLGLVILIILFSMRSRFPIQFKLNFASTQIPESGIQTAVPSPLPSGSFTATSAGKESWNLFAKLKLTDSTGSPQVGSHSITFKLYNNEFGSSPLWTADPQSVTTDSNGATLISLAGVPTDLFWENNQLYLEPGLSSGQGSPLSERIPVSTASVASNLGGYYPADPEGAVEETIPVINSDGELVLASQSPAVRATEGNFLIEGQAVTLKTTDGADGNIVVNPDGKGIAQFLFEGSGKNFLTAQAPNLTSGSLYYGLVANNSTGYDLIRLQSGATPTTKLSVNALGNTYLAGDLNVANDIKTSGTTRLTTTGQLQNITGYSQNSGNFTINQNPGDFAAIAKTGTALSDVLTLTLDERPKPTYANTDYSTLVLNRFDGSVDAMALLVDEGNARFNGQLQLGGFTSNPSAIGQGSLVFNTSDNQVYVWDGTIWTAVGSGAGGGSFADLTSGTNTTAAMVVGTGGSLTYSGSGTINATTLNSTADTSFLRSDASDNYTSGTMTTDAGTIFDINGDLTVSDANIVFDAANTTFTTTGDLTLAPSGGDVAITGDLQISSGISTFSTAVSDGTIEATKFCTGDGETNCVTDFAALSAGSGQWTLTGNNLYPTTLLNLVGIGTASPLSRLSVVNNPGGGNLTGKAAFLVDQWESEDILTASASGVTKMTLANDGTLKLYNASSTISNTSGDITLDAASGTISFAGDSLANIGTLTAGTGIFTSVLQAAGSSAAAYSRFGTATTGHGLSTGDDVLIGSDLELNGVLYLDGSTISNSLGTASIILSSTPTTTASFLTGSNWLVENTANVGQAALMVNQTKAGDLFTASAGGVTKFTISNNGDVTLGNNAGTDLTVGGGTGKIDAGTVDPPYTINGKKFATYLSAMVGIKEEVTGQADTSQYIPGVGYRYVIDFNSLPEGSDLWLFGKTTDIKKNIAKVSALLTSSSPTRTWYETDRENSRLIIYTARPAQVSFRLTAPRFDAQNWGNTRGDESQAVGFVINDADIQKAINEVINIQKISDFLLGKAGDAGYILKNSAGEIVDGVESIGSFVAGNIRAGAIETSDFVSENIIAKVIKTEIISPVPGGADVRIQIGDRDREGKLAVQNAAGEEVASITSEGHVSASSIEIDSANVVNDATVAGTLYADDIKSKSLDEIHELLAKVETDQTLLRESANWNVNTATGSAQLDELAISDLYVTNQAAFNSLSLSQSLALGSDLILQSEDSSLNTLSSPLRLQSLAMAPVEIMSGLVKIDTSGNVQIAGNLFVAGAVTTQTGFKIQDSRFNDVASIDASGSARFKDVLSDKFIIAGSEATISASLLEGLVTQTNSTIGTGLIPQGTREITIKSPKISNYTLVYVTPTSDTQNYVLYVKEKGEGYFKAGFDRGLDIDVSFNWWVVDVVNNAEQR